MVLTHCAKVCLAFGFLTLVAASPPADAFAWPQWLRPPALTDQQPKFNALAVGSTTTDAETIMGPPNFRHEVSTVLGTTHITLIWIDLNSRYTARFLAGRLYLKEQGPVITAKGNTP